MTNVAAGAGSEVLTDEQVIERLKASKSIRDAQSYAEGMTRGRTWARHDALYAELVALDKFQADYGILDGYPWESLFRMTEEDADGAPDHQLAALMRPNPDLADEKDLEDAAAEFWGDVAGIAGEEKLRLDSDWLRGFCDGALQAWRAVKDRVNGAPPKRKAEDPA